MITGIRPSKLSLRVGVAMGLVMLSVALVSAPTPARADSTKSNTFYVVVAHPDDETSGWSYLEQLPKDTYLVFVLITRGEGTDSCITPEEAENNPGTDALAPTDLGTFGNRLVGLPTATPEDSNGPYKYEGPDSPVGEPDKSERHPLGYPWVGQFTEACADARVASWHWFLDGQFRNDGIGTDLAIEGDPEIDDDYAGAFCPPGHQGQGAGRSVETQIGCAQVWANDLGARIVYDLGDQGFVNGELLPTRFTSEQVTAVLQTTRQKRGEWGLPILKETGVLTPNVYGDGESCKRFAGSDHDVINQAIRHTDQGLPMRAGIMYCATDRLGEGATVREIVQSPTSAVLYNLMNPVTGERIGPLLVNYGWVISDYFFPGCLDCFYWEVRS